MSNTFWLAAEMIQLVETEAQDGQRCELGEEYEYLSHEAMQNGYSRDYAGPIIFVRGS